MTDELAGGAAAPAEDVATPDIQSNTPEPITEATPRGAIDRAFAALDTPAENGAEGKPETPVAPVDGDRPRNPDGTFAPKDPATATQPVDTAAKPEKPVTEQPTTPSASGEAPARFSPDAKAAWATVAEPVKAEVNRAIRELEGGIEGYRQQWEPLKQFDEIARQNNTTLPDALQRYVAFDVMLSQDVVRGLHTIAQDKGFDLKAVAAHILGQEAPAPDQQAQIINGLNQKIAALEQQVGGVSTHIQTQQQTALRNEIESFASDAAFARFDELAGDITFFIETRVPKDLPPRERLAQAYALAERLNPAPAVVAPTPAPAPDLTAQTRKGQLSVTGAPSSGSNPSNRKPPSSPRDAIDRAFDTVGV